MRLGNHRRWRLTPKPLLASLLAATWLLGAAPPTAAQGKPKPPTGPLTGPKSGAAGSVKTGVVWHRGNVLSALNAAKTANKRLLIKFTASWCTYCHALEREVLATAAGADLTDGMLAVKVDFDAPQNRRFVEKFVVLGLPTSIVVKPNGVEAGRIMGYESSQSFTKALEQLRTGGVSVSRLQAQMKAHPSDPSIMRQLGQVLLERGNPARGEALLEQVTWLAPHSDAAANALFVLGRYYHRVKQEPETARHIWRELASRFPKSSWAPGAWWWYARAQAEMGRPLAGAFSLEQRARLADSDELKATAISAWGSFVVKHRLKTVAVQVIAAIDATPKAQRLKGFTRLRSQLRGLRGKK